MHSEMHFNLDVKKSDHIQNPNHFFPELEGESLDPGRQKTAVGLGLCGSPTALCPWLY